MNIKHGGTQFAVLGLGKFGFSIVETLAEYDVNILACDNDPAKVKRVANIVTHALELDLENEEDLKSLDLGNFDAVIIGTGEEFETSLIAAVIAREAGVENIIIKATSFRQKKILENLGFYKVILPEYEIGKSIAKKLLKEDTVDVLESFENFNIIEIQVKKEWINKKLSELDIYNDPMYKILAILREDDIVQIHDREVLKENDIIIVLERK